MAPWLGGLLGCGRGQNPSSGLPCGPVFGGVEWWAVGGRGVARTRLRGPHAELSTVAKRVLRVSEDLF